LPSRLAALVAARSIGRLDCAAHGISGLPW
jgi:hypothetical protein